MNLLEKDHLIAALSKKSSKFKEGTELLAVMGVFPRHLKFFSEGIQKSLLRLALEINELIGTPNFYKVKPLVEKIYFLLDVRAKKRLAEEAGGRVLTSNKKLSYTQKSQREVVRKIDPYAGTKNSSERYHALYPAGWTFRDNNKEDEI